MSGVKSALLVLILVAGCGGTRMAPRREREESERDLDVDRPRTSTSRSTVAPTHSSPSTTTSVPTGARRSFTGRAIDLDLKDADVHNVLRLLSDVGNVNIVVPDDVQGAVTLRIEGVPW